ncbi:MAG: ATP synthase F1 subunit gamma [Candidatus Daviesbacteria bacterium]|nr:ATP synthase F1 subunit gamma [Candidatus Daviesbacteria bacterium]
MANTRELRRRIKSIKNTSQITKAMQMVAATKMRRAQNQATSGRPYVENLSEALARLLPRINMEAHPLLIGNDSKTTGVILLSTDKGLVGALNTNLIRTLSSLRMQGSNYPSSRSELDSRLSGNDNIVYYTVGRKGRSFIARTNQDLKADFENADNVSFRQAKQLCKLIMEDFKAEEIGEVYLIYPHFVSTLKQEPRRVKLLPIDLDAVILNEVKDLKTQSRDSSLITRNDKGGGNEFLFEPNADALLDYLLVHHIEEQIYQALLETKASEHSARMIAMQNATDNAKELVGDLTLAYNQTRQASITTELLEITTAQVAME